jgi:hypothetical protein
MTFSETSRVFAFELVLLGVFVLFDGMENIFGSILLIPNVALVNIPFFPP